MNRENFIVRMQLEAVERFQQRESWDSSPRPTSRSCRVRLRTAQRERATIESRLFDLTALKMQLAFAEGDTGTFEQHRRRVVEIAVLLEEKNTSGGSAHLLGLGAGERASGKESP